MQFTFMELWASMGPFAKSIVGLLVLMSLASLATALERLVAVRDTERRFAEVESEWRAAWTMIPGGDARREAYDRTVRRTILATGARLRRGLAVLATVGSTAPFVGLVGTVLGIVNAFAQLASSGHGGVSQVSAGIAEALVTTAFGIGVAIPAVWLFNLLTQRIGRVLVALECRAQDVAVAALREAT